MSTVSRWGVQPALKYITNYQAAARATGLGWQRVRNACLGLFYPCAEVREALAEYTGQPVEKLFTPEVLSSPRPVPGGRPRKAVRS